MKTIIGGLLACTALAAALPAAAQTAAPAPAPSTGNDLSITAGADYSSGSYDTGSKTDILIAPVTVTDKTGMWRFSATLPYLRINGANVVLGPDGRPLPGVPGASGVRSGFGDLSLAATATLPPDKLGGFSVDLTGRVELPTSDKKQHLGTGKTDYSVEADISRGIGDWAPFVTVGYRMPGSPPGVRLRNTFSGSVGTSLALGRTVAIVSYDYGQAMSPFAKDAQDLFGALSGPLTRKVNWTVYGAAGLSKGAPDYEAGLLFTFKL